MTSPTADDGRPTCPTGERLQKVLARAGLGSRRVVRGADRRGPRHRRRRGRGARASRRPDARAHRRSTACPSSTATDLVYYLLNKPRGYVTHRVTIPRAARRCIDLVPAEPRVFPVGRLDCDTEGLLLLTNDGELTQLLTHPSHGVEKEYLAEVDGVPTPGALRALREGVELDDGADRAGAGAAGAAPRATTRRSSSAIHEGRNRQVRRMCEAIGHPVRRLVRTRIGPLARPASSRPGEWRALQRRRGAARCTTAAARDGAALNGQRPGVRAPG